MVLIDGVLLTSFFFRMIKNFLSEIAGSSLNVGSQ